MYAAALKVTDEHASLGDEERVSVEEAPTSTVLADRHCKTNDTTVMSVDAAANKLGIGRTLAWEMARAGTLPGVGRLGRRVIVSREALDRYLADPQSWPHEVGNKCARSGRGL
ncbi:MAG: helix-turn-helix domain-containing protein [Acidimicrobiales bacterium]